MLPVEPSSLQEGAAPALTGVGDSGCYSEGKRVVCLINGVAHLRGPGPPSTGPRPLPPAGSSPSALQEPLLGLCGQVWEGGPAWQLALSTVPRGLLLSARSVLSSEITAIVPGLCLQVLWPRLCPAWSIVASFHLDWLPMWRRTSTTSGPYPGPSPAVSPTTPWSSVHP